jgi:arsenate reductase
MITIYHNPRCSKSREALAIAEQFAARQNESIDVVEYLKTPLTVERLKMLRAQLGGDIRDMVRGNEEEYAKLNLASADDAGILNALAAHPKLLQRPIVVYKGRAMIGRPPERLGELLKAG